MKIALDLISKKSNSSQQQYIKRRCLGKGGEGEVYDCIERSTGQNVALKIIRQHQYSIQRRLKPVGKQTSGLRHRNIVEVKKKYRLGRQICVVMELCDGDLLSEIENCSHGRYNEFQACQIILQALNGLIACRDKDIFHGDIKPENILLRKSVVKLADFLLDFHDFSERNQCNKNSDLKLGTVEYLAPELLQRPTEQSSTLTAVELAAADVWALGLTLFVMVAGYMPWQLASSDDSGYEEYMRDPESMWPSWFSSELCSLLGGMLQQDVSRRLTLREVWEHSWLVSARGGEPRPELEPLRIEDAQGAEEDQKDNANASTPDSCVRSHSSSLSPRNSEHCTQLHSRKRSFSSI